jgi:DMSO/TMAO reductase YedYZ molybdopterin-dependent catalytic subunit
MSPQVLALMAVVLITTLVAGCATPPQPTAPAAPAATDAPPTVAAQPTEVPSTVAAQPTAAQPASADAGDVALMISGKVDQKMAWTEEEVRAMPVIQVKGTNSQGASEDYTGVSLNDLLKQAGVQSGAATLVFTAEGGQTSEAALSEVQACAECILSFRSRGGFSLRMPGFPAAVQLKGVTAITVQ